MEAATAPLLSRMDVAALVFLGVAALALVMLLGSVATPSFARRRVHRPPGPSRRRADDVA